MKNIVLVLLLAVLRAVLCPAQSQTMPQQIAHAYAPLDKSKTATGYLIDLSIALADPHDYRGTLSDSNFTDINTFGLLYAEMRGAQTPFGLNLPSPKVYLNKIRKGFDGQVLPIAIMNWRYDEIRLEAGFLNLINYTNGQYFDVPASLQSPYMQDTLVIATSLFESVNTLRPGFTLPLDLWFSNWSLQMPQISIDFGDGAGWQIFGIGDTINANYNNIGEKEITVRLDYGGFAKYCHSKLTVVSAPSTDRVGAMNWPQELHQILPVTSSKAYTDPSGVSAFGNATMHIFF
jgi:hypothetical protein